MTVINKAFLYWRIAMKENETKKESRECGKGEVIRRGANIQKLYKNMWIITTGFSARARIAQARANRVSQS